eukprot:CAMPEP_0198234252 /NCGR_PEP_ID=MMETSP1446-20131203/310_1 /TAXON_ID=1461542 ORGANISM="Unidentified sp, Strain CCMP2111" /NCGR_SAMPLE_ID=MMETSP1446 /ASSEMBLY_ACC=CAM_ASM_001112 /LENGTH=763 /DNA_ID=CAMNT_0043914999 /DNA_START=109 /DNA_END=2400 /DNA_ORIENTATION=-
MSQVKTHLRSNWRAYTLAGLSAVVIVAVSLGISAAVYQSKGESFVALNDGEEACKTSECTSKAAYMLETSDVEVDPCENFYEYTCGGFVEDKYLPSSAEFISTFTDIYNKLELSLLKILENAHKKLVKSGRTYSESDTGIDKATEFFTECMNVTNLDQRGVTPLMNILGSLGTGATAQGSRSRWSQDAVAFGNVEDYKFKTIRDLHLQQIPVFVKYFVAPDDGDSTRYTLNVRQGNLGLPDPSYYIETDDGSEGGQSVLDGYKKLMTEGLDLLREKSIATAAAKGQGTSQRSTTKNEVKAIVGLETKLAACHVPRNHFNYPKARYNVMDLPEADSLFPIGWKELFQEVLQGQTVLSNTRINIETPSALSCMTQVIEDTELSDIVSYMKWFSLLTLSDDLDEDMRDWRTRLASLTAGTGGDSRPRWQGCIRKTMLHYGYALSEAYIEEEFSPQSKESATGIVKAIKNAFVSRLPQLTWMDKASKKAAKKKAERMKYDIGYPDWVLDNEEVDEYYSQSEVDGGKFIESSISSVRANLARDLAKLFSRVDSGHWDVLPIDLNAYYAPTQNKIAFPAAILQAPFFENGLPPSVNYGALGMIVGHEFSHGFDSVGRKYNTRGNLKSWWTEEDNVNFEEMAQCFVDQYSQYEKDGMGQNGNLTLGENMADNAGLELAHHAFVQSRDRNKNSVLPNTPWTPEQLFFVSFGQIWCSSATPESVVKYLKTDFHSLPEFRVNGAVSNSPDFSRAFQCKAGSKMNPKHKCDTLY